MTGTPPLEVLDLNASAYIFLPQMASGELWNVDSEEKVAVLIIKTDVDVDIMILNFNI